MQLRLIRVVTSNEINKFTYEAFVVLGLNIIMKSYREWIEEGMKEEEEEEGQFPYRTRSPWKEGDPIIIY